MSKSFRTEDGQELELKEGQILDSDEQTVRHAPEFSGNSGPHIKLRTFRTFPVLGLIGSVVAIVAFGGVVAIVIGTALVFGLVAIVLRPILSLLGIRAPFLHTVVKNRVFIKRRF